MKYCYSRNMTDLQYARYKILRGLIKNNGLLLINLEIEEWEEIEKIE